MESHLAPFPICWRGSVHVGFVPYSNLQGDESLALGDSRVQCLNAAVYHKDEEEGARRKAAA